MENKVQPKPENSASHEEVDQLVEHFLEAFSDYEANPERISKLSDVQSDYDELEYYSESGNTSSFAQVRPGAFYKIMRVYDIDSSELPKTKPVDDRTSLTTLSIVDSAKSQIWLDGGMQDVWDDVRHRFKAEGTALVQIGFDSEGKYIPMECCDLTECYFDASKQHLATDSRRTGKCIKTFIRTVEVDWGEFISMYPDYKDKVNPGSPAAEARDGQANTKIKAEDQNKDTVTIHYAYSIEDSENPVMAVYAGSNKVLLDKSEGKEYPFWIKRGTGDYPFLPFIDAHVSNVRRGFYSPSVIGLMKDKIETLRKVFFYSMPVFEKAVNPILLLLGSKDERLMEEMSLAREMQSMGESYVIPTSENVSVQEVKPNSIFGEVEQARTMLLRELSAVFGFNVQELEEVEQTATEFVGKTKAELKAISGLYKINKSFFEKSAEYCVALAARYWKTSDKRLVQFEIEDGSKLDMELGIALSELKEFKGQFKVETDLKMPLSSQDKRQANQTLLGMVNALLAVAPQLSEDAIAMQVEAIEMEAGLSDLDHIYSKPKLTKMFMSQEVPTGAEMPGQPAPQQNPEVTNELSPNAFLSAAGLENS